MAVSDVARPHVAKLRTRHALAPRGILAVFLLLGPFAVAIPTACVTVEARVPNTSPISRDSAYVGGLFRKDTFVGFGFGVRNVKTQQEYVLPFQDSDVALIEVPPGFYRVAYWITWSLTGSQLTRKEIPERDAFARGFQLEPGEVMLLGSWSADRQWALGWNRFTIVPKGMTTAQAAAAFKASYPGFANAAISCLVCR